MVFLHKMGPVVACRQLIPCLFFTTHIFTIIIFYRYFVYLT